MAGSLCGIKSVWASEIEPYTIAVTRKNFPDMKHLGDISKVNGAEIEPVEIITFGSPCQDLSVAGQQNGLKHKAKGDNETTRSGLFIEAIRIIKEMRNATNGTYPRYAVWENVCGAFSSNKGRDFKTVLEEFIKIKEPKAPTLPMPENGWAYADCIMGDGWSIAYRTVDAQYWGVPQRRRRIYLVADFGGERAPEILFKQEGVCGYFEASGTQRKNFATDVTRSIESSCVGNYLIYDARENSDGKLDTLGSVTCYENNSFGGYKEGVGTLRSFGGDCGGGSETLIVEQNTKYIVRRLTPTECARLQGFPDGWGHIQQKEKLTDDEYQFWLKVRNTYASINNKPVKNHTKEQMLKWYNKLWSNSAEYKMWGNGIALPNALYVMQGISNIEILK